MAKAMLRGRDCGPIPVFRGCPPPAGRPRDAPPSRPSRGGRLIGSVGRVHDFDGCFRPKTKGLRTAIRERAADPSVIDKPIALIQVDHGYFVEDGHKRLSLVIAAGRTRATRTSTNSRPSSTSARGPRWRRSVPWRAAPVPQGDRSCGGMSEEAVRALGPGRLPGARRSVKAHTLDLSHDEGRLLSPEEGARHWYETVFKPVLDIVEKAGSYRLLESTTDADRFLLFRRGITGPMAWGWRIHGGRRTGRGEHLIHGPPWLDRAAPADLATIDPPAAGRSGRGGRGARPAVVTLARHRPAGIRGKLRAQSRATSGPGDTSGLLIEVSQRPVATERCSICGTARAGSFRYCLKCRFDFEPSTELARPIEPSHAASTSGILAVVQGVRRPAIEAQRVEAGPTDGSSIATEMQDEAPRSAPAGESVEPETLPVAPSASGGIPTASACPYLGLVDDAATHFMFASPGHRCHVAGKVEKISLPHQGAYCLSETFQTCPRFPASDIVEGPAAFDDRLQRDRAEFAARRIASPAADDRPHRSALRRRRGRRVGRLAAIVALLALGLTAVWAIATRPGPLAFPAIVAPSSSPTPAPTSVSTPPTPTT